MTAASFRLGWKREALGASYGDIDDRLDSSTDVGTVNCKVRSVRYGDERRVVHVVLLGGETR